MKTPKIVSGSDGTSRMSAQRYLTMAAALLQKETAKKRSYSVSQDGGNDQSKGSPKSGNTPESHKFGCKRQRVALVTEQETCSRDGPITHGHLRHSIVKDVYTLESSRSAQVKGASPARNKKEGKLRAMKDICAQELSRSAQGDSSLTSNEKEEEKLCGKKGGVEGSPQAPLAGLSNTRLVEYWVPVQLSNAQLEQYFYTLITNSDLLSSSSKRGRVEDLQDVLVALKKCCDHPYVLDPSLQSSLKGRSPLRDYLSIGIETGGKLQLLSKLLAKIREQGLRVLIVYKAIDTRKNGLGIGHILDDFIHQSFGGESYVHVFTQSCVNPRGKQAAVDLSNERTGGKFIILTEYSSSSVNIRLSSDYVVILFNGDWNPANDIRALQKIKLHTESDNLRVFRLYSVHTLEEKVLCLARDGAAANTHLRYLNRSVCHSLIAWGAAHLYERLDILHETAAFGSAKSSEDDFVSSIMHELSNLLSSEFDDFDISHSIISKANWVDEMYRGDIKLHGEREVHSLDDVPSHIFWSSLLDGLRPRWIFLPEKSEKRRVLSCQRPSGIPEDGMRAVFPLPEGTRHNTKRRKMVRRSTVETQSHQERLGLTALMVAMRRTSCKKAGESKSTKSISSQSSTSLGQGVKETGSSCQRGKRKLDDKFMLEFQEVCREMDERWANLRDADLSTRNDIEEQGSTILESLKSPTGSVHEEPDDTQMNASPALTNANPCMPPVDSNLDSESGNKTSINDQMPTLIAEKCSPVPAIADEPTLSGSSSVKQSDNLSAALTLENPNVSSVSSAPLVAEAGPDIMKESQHHAPRSLLSNQVSREDFNDESDGILMPHDISDSDKPASPVSLPLPSVPRTSDNVNTSYPSLFSVPESEANILGEHWNHSPQNDMPCSLAVNENHECGAQCAKDGIPGDVVGLFHDDEQACEIPDAIPIGESEIAEYLSEEAPGNQHEEANRMHGTVSHAGSSPCIPLPNCVTDEDRGVQGSLNEGTADGEPRQQFPANFSANLSSSRPIPGQMLLQHCTDRGSHLPFGTSSASTPPPSSENGILGHLYVDNATCSQQLHSPTTMQFHTHLGSHPADDTSYYLQNCSTSSYTGVNSHASEDILCTLEGEIERIQNAEAEATKMHEDMVLQLESVRDREVALISEKYDRLLQDATNDLAQKGKDLQARHEKINAHKSLAWSWTLVADEDSPIDKMFNLPLPVHSAGLASSNSALFHSPQIVSQFPDLSTYPVARGPYFPVHHSPTNRPNPYFSSYIQSRVFNPYQFNQQILNSRPSGSHTQQLTNLERRPFPYDAPV